MKILGTESHTEPYFSDFHADVLTPPEHRDVPVVLIWHGRGPNERQVLRPLAARLAEAGAVVVVPDYSPFSETGGRDALLASIDWTLRRCADLGADHGRLCLLGWSFGARAAVGHVLERADSSFRRVVGLAGSYGSPAPTSSAPPLALARQKSAAHVLLVHGQTDSINPIRESEELQSVFLRAGTKCDLVKVDTDHAGVILTRFDETLGICVPEPSPTPSSLTVFAAITDFVFRQ